MSRSVRKHSKDRHAKAGSMKWWRRQYNKTIRKKTRQKLHQDQEDTAEVELPQKPHDVTIGDEWSSPQDGQAWYFDKTDADYKKRMRK
jgi:hypothetical protein